MTRHTKKSGQFGCRRYLTLTQQNPVEHFGLIELCHGSRLMKQDSVGGRAR